MEDVRKLTKMKVNRSKVVPNFLINLQLNYRITMLLLYYIVILYCSIVVTLLNVGKCKQTTFAIEPNRKGEKVFRKAAFTSDRAAFEIRWIPCGSLAARSTDRRTIFDRIGLSVRLSRVTRYGLSEGGRKRWRTDCLSNCVARVLGRHAYLTGSIVENLEPIFALIRRRIPR